MKIGIKRENVGRDDELLLTITQINRMEKAVSERKGADLNTSKTQIEKTAQHGGNLFSAVVGLARPVIKPALFFFIQDIYYYNYKELLKKKIITKF